MNITDDFFNQFNDRDDDMPIISNEAAYALAEFVQALLLWVDKRYYAQIKAHHDSTMPARYQSNPLWEICDDIDDDTVLCNDE